MPNSKKTIRRKAAVRQTASRKTVGREGKSTRASSAVSRQPVARAPRTGTKLAKVIELLGRKDGVGVAELTSMTNWLPHTARAALTGLRKRGFEIERFQGKDDRSHYRIAASKMIASFKA
jgi:Protein of unknown function (DUF3489)